MDAAADRTIVVNAEALSARQIDTLESTYGTRLLPGRYWYDARTGWWGLDGGPVVGVVAPGLAVGGALHADASHGTTGVFFNGRELHLLEVAYLRMLGPVLPGRYWVDAIGNAGFEGIAWPFANLYVLAQQRYGDRGPHTSSNGAFHSDGQASYFQTRDASGNVFGASSGCG